MQACSHLCPNDIASANDLLCLQLHPTADEHRATADAVLALQHHIDRQAGLVQQLRDDNAALSTRLQEQATAHHEEVSSLQERIEHIKAAQSKIFASQQTADKQSARQAKLAQQVAEVMDAVDGLKNHSAEVAQSNAHAKLRKRQAQLESAILQVCFDAFMQWF